MIIRLVTADGATREFESIERKRTIGDKLHVPISRPISFVPDGANLLDMPPPFKARTYKLHHYETIAILREEVE